jgi:hypothetical protein
MNLRRLLQAIPGEFQYIDNDIDTPGAPEGQGCLVINEEGSCILQIKSRRVYVPRFEAKSEANLDKCIDSLIWCSLRDRAVPGVNPDNTIPKLRQQLPGLTRLYAKPGTPAWDRAVAVGGSLELVEGLGGWGDNVLGPNILIGLPEPLALGVNSKWSEDVQGLLIFPRMIAAIWAVA